MTQQIVIKLELDDKHFRGTISSATGDLRKFEQAVQRSSERLEHNERHHKTWARTLRDSVIVLGLARHAIENVSAVLFSLPRAVIRANAELERMTALMTGLSAETGGMAEAQADATENVRRLFEMAKRAPFEVGAITDAFVKMKAVGLDPMDGMLQGLVDSVAKFGGTPEQLKRASIAIQQMAGKGVISMEELRQQLGESVPDAIQIMARSMGVSMGELVEKVSTGTVEAKNALAAMARQMRIENAGAALQMSETWDGMINRMKTSLTLAAKEIGDAGFFDEVKSQLSFIVDDTLQDPRFFAFMRDLGEAMAVMTRGLAATVDALYRFGGVIVDVTQFLAAFWLVAKVRKNWDFMADGLKKVKNGFVTAGAGVVSLRDDLRRARVEVEHFNRANKLLAVDVANRSVAMAQLTVATNRAAAAFRTFFTAIGGWTTVAMVGIPLAIAAFDRFADKALEAVREIDRNHPEMMTQEQLDALRETIRNYESIESKIKAIKAQEQALTQQSLANMTLLQERGREQLRLASLKGHRAELLEALDGKTVEEWASDALAAEQALLENMLAGFSRSAELQASGALRSAIIDYKQAVHDLIDRQKEMSDDEYLQARKDLEKALAQRVKEQFDRQIAVERRKLEEQQALQTEAAKKQVEIQKLKIMRLEELQKEGLAAFDGTPSEIKTISDKDVDKELTKLQQFLLSREKMLAKYTAKAEDENPFLAEFESMVELGNFADATEAELEKARQTMEKLWQARKKWDAQNAETQAFADSLTRIDQLTGQINTKFAQRQNENPLLRDAIEAEKLKLKLQEVGSEIENLTTIDQSAKQEALERLMRLGEQVENNARAATVAQIKSATAAMNRDLLPAMERTKAEYQELIRQARQWRAEVGELDPEGVRVFYEYLAAINAKMAEDMKTPVDELVDEWSDSTQQIQNLWVNTMESFVDTLTDGLMEGKLELSSFVEEFGRMVIKMQLQKAAAGIVGGLGGLLSGGVGIAASSPGGAGPLNMAVLANGGIMTPKGLAKLETYSNGGIADRPQLALYGEGRQPEAYVPLPDGRTIPVTLDSKGQGAPMAAPVTVNLMNQSGQPMDADSSDMRFDGRQWVLDVVLTGMNQPGGFRSGMKSALSK